MNFVNMEKLHLDHSLKNIPIPTEKEYTKFLVIKIEHFLRRLRWRMIFILDSIAKAENASRIVEDTVVDEAKPVMDETSSEPFSNFGFKSESKPRFVPELAAFEKDLLNIPKILEFENVKRTPLQDDLSKFLKKLNQTNEVLVHADKTRNMYRMKVNEYKKVLNNNISKEYRKSSEVDVQGVNSDTAEIAKKLKLDQRMEVFTTSEAYLLVKDHKEHFPNKVAVRLINPCKTDLGRVSKVILQQLISDLNTVIQQNQWRSSQNVLDWFKSIKGKKSLSFVKFDIVSFYPSIDSKLLSRAMEFAKSHTFISKEDIGIVFQARKSFLYSEGTPWVKRGQENFDVPMGSYDGAEVCELVGLYLLHKISSSGIFEKGCYGIYRDDGLGLTQTHAS